MGQGLKSTSPPQHTFMYSAMGHKEQTLKKINGLRGCGVAQQARLHATERSRRGTLVSAIRMETL